MDFIDKTLVASVQELQVIQQGNFNTACQRLQTFLRESLGCSTEKGDARTNIIDQGAPKTYAFGEERLASLFGHLEACRRSGALAHFSEKQGSPDQPYSGIMLDFDIVLASRPEKTTNPIQGHPVPEVLDARAYRQLCSIVTKKLIKDLNFAGPAGGSDEIAVQFFFLVRPEVTALTAPSGARGYKYGFHILIPGVRTTRGYKKYLINDLSSDDRLLRVLANIGAVGSPTTFRSNEDAAALESCLDAGSASVPVMFFGSCKRAGKVYPLGAAYRVQGELDDILGGGGFTVSPINPSELESCNLCYELSLWARPAYDLVRGTADLLSPGADDAPPLRPTPLVQPKDYQYKDALAVTIESLEDRLAGGVINQNELRAVEAEIDELCHRDPDARYLQQMLALLDENYCAEYSKWRNVIFALCNSGAEAGFDYFPLASWFSQRCPEKWTTGGREALRTLWDESSRGAAMKRSSTNWKPLTRRSIIYWASVCSPAKFRELSQNSNRAILGRYIYGHGGTLEHAMVAIYLSRVLADRFVVDAVTLPNGKSTYFWYEFVSSGQAMQPGEVWKWRREANPDELHKYLSDNVVMLLQQFSKEVCEKEKDARNDDETKYYKGIGKKLAATITKMYNNTFKNNVIDQARYHFRRRGFIKSLDSDPDIIGVANGILRLAGSGRRRSQLISGYHEWPVSRFTEVNYRPFDPEEPWTKLLLDAMKKIVPEIDMRVWLMMFLSTGLYHGLKDPVLLFWIGSGRNAKTFAARMTAKVLGDFATKLQISLLTSDREDASKPNSAFMRLKNRGFGYFEESNRCEVLNTSRLKEIVNPGEVTASEKFGAQETFEITSSVTSLSNFGFIIDTKDDGTWRRIRYYRAKAKFCPEPDAKNPYEHKDDRRFINEYVNDPECQSAFLSILVHFWERLQNEYDGDIASVPSSTLDRETEEYRNSQDVLNRFITERVVSSPEHGTAYPMAEIAGRFCEWYQTNIEAHHRRYVATEVIGDLENSRLSRYLTTAPNGTRVVSGCRCLSAREAAEELKEGEEFIGALAREKRAGANARRFGPGGELEPTNWWDWSLNKPSSDSGAEDVEVPAEPSETSPAPAWTENTLAEDKLVSDGRRRRKKLAAARREAQAELDSQVNDIVASLLSPSVDHTATVRTTTAATPKYTVSDLGDLLAC